MSAVNVIAEVGMTHDGSLGHAIRMAETAAGRSPPTGLTRTR